MLNIGLRITQIFNEKQFTDKYSIRTNQYIEYLALKGDPSDNIPGLPGVGEKSAQRMAFYLLENNREGGTKLSKLLTNAMENIRNCASCRNLTEDIYCDICSDTKRDTSTLCIVESPTDVIAIENSGSFKGKYYVLMGRLSPIDGVNH